MKTKIVRLLPPIISERLGWAPKPGQKPQGQAPAAQPNAVNTFIGMTSISERNYYGQAVRETLNMEGAIVDLGCWLGSTSLSLAQGLPEGSTTKIHAFDQFIWYKWMDQFTPMVACDYLEGESFLPEARRRMNAAKGRIEIEKADLTQYQWNGGPIKLLLVDAMKDKTLCRVIAQSFYPSLLPGSILLHQDFKHYNTSWIHILQYRLRECFKPRQNVPDSGTMSFTTIQAPTTAQLEAAYAFDSIADEEADAAFAYSMSLVSAPEVVAVAAAHIMHYRHTKRADRAKELVADYVKRYDPKQSDLKLAAESVATMKG